MLTKVLDHVETNSMFINDGLVQFVDKAGVLVPMNMNMRVMIDNEADLYIAVRATIIKDYVPFGYLEGDSITSVSHKF